MNTQDGYVTVAGQQLHYLRMGAGKELLVAFHGYGNSASLFLPFVSYLSQQYTIISINLPYHGKSKWTGSAPIEPKDFVALLHALMQQEGVSKVSLLGYSMGGRVCLSIIEHAPELVARTLLIAPDGLVFNAFYYFAMRTRVGKGILTYVLRHPKYFLSVLAWLRHWNLLDPSRYKFLKGHMQSDEARNFLLNVWPVMRKIIPHARKVKEAIGQHQLPVSIFMGAYDRIIIPRYAQQFARGLPTVSVHILQKGHRLFNEESVAEMAKSLL